MIRIKRALNVLKYWITKKKKTTDLQIVFDFFCKNQMNISLHV